MYRFSIDFRVKGSIRIGGAVALGLVIILGAFYVRNSAESDTQTGAVVVAEAPARTAVPVTDSDGDGIEDWKESLQEKFFETIEAPAGNTTQAADEPYEPPMTLTGKFSEAFLQDYLEAKMRGEDFSDPTAFVDRAVNAVDTNTQSVRHSRLELNVVPSDYESIHTYGNEVASIVLSHSVQNENEAVILQRALDANDPDLLEGLMPIRSVYENIIADSLHIDVPDALADEHVALLNAYEAVLADIKAMQVAFTDPLFALARVRGYEADARSLYEAFRALAQKLTGEGGSYLNDEPGAFLYRFKT